MTELEPRHVEPLAKLLMAIRPDWSLTYTVDAVSRMRLVNPNLERVVAAAVRGALSPRIAKPDVLAMTGDHWRVVVPEPTGPPKATHCADCRDSHPPGPCTGTGPPVTLDKHAERMAQLRGAHANAATTWHGRLCSCGADARGCQRHEEGA